MSHLPTIIRSMLKIIGHNSEEAEKAVEHICFLVDVNRLYDNALGLYDLELALLVAQQSQKVGSFLGNGRAY